jgi:hypothetical protein
MDESSAIWGLFFLFMGVGIAVFFGVVFRMLGIILQGVI